VTQSQPAREMYQMMRASMLADRGFHFPPWEKLSAEEQSAFRRLSERVPPEPCPACGHEHA
jgi:hypothetical protein